MSKVIIPEQTFTKDVVQKLAPVQVDQTADGWSVKIGCAKWPAKTMGKFRVFADFGAKTGPIVLFEGGISGGGLDKQGNPAQFSTVSGTWPGQADSKGQRVPVKPPSIYVEFAPVEPLTSTVEIDAALKASGMQIVGGVEIPIP